MIRSKAFTRGNLRFGSSTSARTLSYFVAPGVYQDRYGETIKNLKIGSHTRVIFQGFTGKQATANAKESIEWGTNIVGGVAPGKAGEHLGLPVFPTVEEAVKQLKPDATGIYVAAQHAAGAIEEAIAAEVPLIVAVAEHIPLHDMLRVNCILDTQTKSRLVGANSPGIISAIGKCRIGFHPLSCFTPGRIGIVAKSGTLSYEAAASTTRAGLGQSLCIGMGGDLLAGTNFVDALKVFEHDDDTEGIIIIGEIGGEEELEAAAWIEEYKKRSSNPKPIAALVAGINAPPRKVMGQAGAILLPGDPDAKTKIEALEKAGVTMVNHPSRFGNAMKLLLGDSGRSSSVSQKRGIHTLRLRPTSKVSTMVTQKRTLFMRTIDARLLLVNRGTLCSKKIKRRHSPGYRQVKVSIDRSNRCPCVTLQFPNKESGLPPESRKKFFSYNAGLSEGALVQCWENFNMTKQPKPVKAIIPNLCDLFKEKEALLLHISIPNPSKDKRRCKIRKTPIVTANFAFDDAAFKTANRHPDIHSLPPLEAKDSIEEEAQKKGIVYIKLPDNGNIGILANGAGLAMNTIDALADAGGEAANFLDTGGKASKNLIQWGFEAILADERVKVVFVNIFGGLTLGDMIARGILLAFKELGVSVPVVVRIRGTNEEEGQRIIAESGLPIYAYDDFDEAAAKVVELANSNNSSTSSEA